MKWKHAFFFILIAFVVINCSKTKKLVVNNTRTFSPKEIFSFHKEMNVKVGWMPYQNHRVVKTGENNWKIIESNDEIFQGNAPVILVTYASGDSILLDMNIENELLGKLIKHSAMTQQPITRPFNAYLEKAKCDSCHPQYKEVNFER
jgi:hypothetical protein